MYEEPGWTDDFEDDDSLSDWPDEPDADVDEPAYVPCPECGEEVFDDSEQCPYCGQYITFSTSPWMGRSPAWILLGILGVIAVIYTLLGF